MEAEERKRMIGWIAAPFVIVAGDGAVKKCAEKKLADGKTKELFGGRIRLQLLHNPGVMLGALKKDPKLILVINSVLLGVAAGTYARLIKKEKAAVAKAGLALLIGGGASNLIDRIQRGYVTDYFSIEASGRFQKLSKVVFNCSDFCVFGGILCYLLAGSKEDDA